MIKITVDLCPYGDETNPKRLGEMKIWNDATGNHSIGNYGFKIFKKGSNKSVWKSGEVKGFRRLKLSAWDLLYRVLREAIGNRNV